MPSEDYFELMEQHENECNNIVNRYEAFGRKIENVIYIAEHTEEILEDLDRQFCRRTGLTKTDWIFLITAVGLQVVRQKVFQKLGNRITDKQGDKLMKDILKVGAPDWKDVLTQSVPYDAIKTGNHISNTGLSGTTHRYRTLGHDPVLGWIFGTANIMTRSLTKNDFTTYQVSGNIIIRHYPNGTIGMFEKATEYAVNDPKLLAASVARQAVHFGSDYFTKQGLPVPMISIVDESLAKDMLTKYHINMLSVTNIAGNAMFASLINQIIAYIHGLFFNGESEMEHKLYEIRTRKIVCYSNMIASTLNIAETAFKAYATEDPTKLSELDIGGFLVAVSEFVRSSKFKRQVYNEFVFGTYKDMILNDDIFESDIMTAEFCLNY